jgi:hypothetical protein
MAALKIPADFDMSKIAPTAKFNACSQILFSSTKLLTLSLKPPPT